MMHLLTNRDGFMLTATAAGSRGARKSGRALGGAYVDVRFERLMHRTFVRDLHQTLTLLGVEWAFQGDGAIDVIDLGDLVVAVLAIFRVDLFLVIEPHRDVLQRNFFKVGVKPDRHRGTGTKPGQQEIIWPRTRIQPTELDRFVSQQVMRPRQYLLLKFASTRLSHQHEAGFDLCFGHDLGFVEIPLYPGGYHFGHINGVTRFA